MAKQKKIVSFKEALESGKSVYFTGKPCKRGHLSQRYVSSCACIECLRIDSLARRMEIKQIRMNNAEKAA